MLKILLGEENSAVLQQFSSNSLSHRNKLVLQDSWLQRGLLLIVIFYFFITLVLPLTLLASKAFQSFSFDLSIIEILMKKNGAWQDEITLADWQEKSEYVANHGLRASERSRELITNIIPKTELENIELYRVLDNSFDGVLLLDGKVLPHGNWIELSTSDLANVQIKPVMQYSIANFVDYFSTSFLRQSIFNSLKIAALVSLIVTPIAFLFAYGIIRTRIVGKTAFRLVAFIPVLIPSVLPAIGLVYLFGRQGIITPLLMGQSVYGPIGIILASIFFTFPHALVIMIVSLGNADKRLYEAAEVLCASPLRIFITITLPAARYGFISTAFVVFTLVVTDFGVPKVIGDDYQMLAIDIYKQVIGQQNFQMGAVVSMLLLLPAIFAFCIERFVSKKQISQLTARAVPYSPDINRKRDIIFFIICLVVSVFILLLVSMCQLASVAKFWPYNITPVLSHFDFNHMDGGGWTSYWNSLQLAFYVATLGIVVVFCGAYITEKIKEFSAGRFLLQLLAIMPMAIPGMVLGLGYIFFFNNPSNPLHFLYGTMAILVICTITHLYTVPHLTATTALKQMDSEFESVSLSLKQPLWRILGRVSAPVCFPAISEIWIYLFVNAMTTVSALVFIYSPNTTLASIAVLNMDDAGDVAAAAAMGMMIFYTNVIVRIAHSTITNFVIRRQHNWRSS
ncbi:putative 2-aminoethylphosphonate ABC transporter permease subunit [Bartonella tamiae]|uniref:ABC transmembrane type-1 domain-containing protein n=1 Tax=Bartonella tamiae Th239 TaxID=1094558 RepID=J0QT15_9HYPH|nr:putative 2-aminoethylphosphonate ABC transporter permease subunit [Bartonella tamiae]EJF89006.1 hypothetical protein ME5_01557 [Bartonella tamiae Th239]EJF94744.1 hypothetical protein MEG_00325 [Bartonella tamiae Th307]